MNSTSSLFNKLISRMPIFFLFLVAVVNGFLVSQGNYGYLSKEAGVYDLLAQALVKNHSFSLPLTGLVMNREPGYPLFLSLIYLIFGHSTFAVFIIQIIFFGCIALLIFYISQLFLNKVPSMLVGFMTALFVPLASYTGMIYSEILFTLLFLLWILFFVKAEKTNNKILFLISGLCFGLATLTKVINFYLLFFVLIYFIVKYYKCGIKKLLMKIFLFSFAAALIVTPWMARNKYNFDSFSITTRGGFVLYIRADALNLSAWKYYEYISSAIFGDYITGKIFFDYEGNYEDLTYIPSIDRVQSLVDLRLSDTEIDKILILEAKALILKRPLLYLTGSLVELFKLNSPMNATHFSIMHMFVETHSEIPSWVKVSIILFIRFIYWVFFLIVIYGIYKSATENGGMKFISLVIFGFNVFYILFDTISRYSLPVFPLYILLFIYGSSRFFAKRFLNLKNIFFKKLIQ